MYKKPWCTGRVLLNIAYLIIERAFSSGRRPHELMSWGSSSACYYHVVSLDMRKLFVEVSLTSDGGRIYRVLGMMCFQFQGQNDIYSTFAFSLSHSAMFSGAHSKGVQWRLCILYSLYVSPEGKGRRQGNNLAWRDKDAIWRSWERHSSRRFRSIIWKPQCLVELK